MHEYPATQQIIKIAEEACRNAGAERVIKISLAAGRNCGFAGESIDMYFSVISEGTLCEGAAIEIVPAESAGDFYIREIEVE